MKPPTRRFSLSSLALSLSLLFTIPPPSQAVSNSDSSVPERLSSTFSELREQGFAGFVVVAKDGEIIFADGAGLANAETNRPFTLDTQIDTLSITKTFTGMVAAQLITLGDLSPSDTLKDFFPDIPSDKADISLHQLLTHTSGFVSVLGSDTNEDDQETFLSQAFSSALLFEPGSDYAYSNVGYSIVAVLIEKVTETSFEDHLIDAYLSPAALTHTGYMRAYDDRLAAHDVRMRSLIDASWGGHSPNWHLMGNGGLVSTPREMISWLASYSRGEIVSPEAVALAHQPHVLEGEGASSHYGYGLVVEDHPEYGQIFWHNGGSRHFNSHWREHADHGYTLFVTTNAHTVSADMASLAMEAALFENDFEIRPRIRRLSDPVALPDTAFGVFAQEFLDTVAQESPLIWQNFIDTRLSENMLSHASRDQYLETFQTLHNDFGVATLIGWKSKENKVILVVQRPDSGESMRIILDLDDLLSPNYLTSFDVRSG